MKHLHQHTSHPCQPFIAERWQRQKRNIHGLAWVITFAITVVIGCLVL